MMAGNTLTEGGSQFNVICNSDLKTYQCRVLCTNKHKATEWTTRTVQQKRRIHNNA